MTTFNIQIKGRTRKLVVDGIEFQFPDTIKDYLIKGEYIIVRFFSAGANPEENHDLQLPSLCHNIVGLTKEEQVWTIAEPPHAYSGEDRYNSFRYLYELTDQVFAHHRNGYIYHIDHETGKLLDSWPDHKVPIGETVVTLDGSLLETVELDGTVFLHASETEKDVYAFEPDGTLRWQRNLPGKIYNNDGELWGSVERGPRTQKIYPIDHETGETGEFQDFY